MQRQSVDQEKHWADRIAAEVLATVPEPVISTGISPSGDIHVGNLREVLTADAVYRALRDAGGTPRFNYIADNFDPLRRVYPFLDAERYAPLVGQPLSDIPCPCGRHPSYSEHFLEPFLAALEELRVDVEVERADQMYKSGRMTPYIVQALERRDRIAEILQQHTGKQTGDDWSPFNPWCPDCRKITEARVVGFSAEQETVDYTCACGSSGSVPMAGGGKLVWRIDWPARWMLLHVTIEPFGKDHATRGGSYDTGKPIVEEIFGGAAPFPIPYEWIRLKGAGDMSSSKGNVLSVRQLLDVVPPEVIRYSVMRKRPEKTILFDPGVPLLQLVDQVDDATAGGRDERALELSTAAGFEPVGVPFKHLVVVAQATGFDADAVLRTLERTGVSGLSRTALERRLAYARRWIDSFAPEEIKFSVQAELPREARELDSTQRSFLGQLAGDLRDDMDGEAVHERIHEIAKEYSSVKPGHLFQAIYISLLGKQRGPRAGWFVALLGPEFCAVRFKEASK